MTYRFPEPRVRQRRTKRAYLPEEKKVEEIGLIQGMVPDSKEEWWVAKALWKLGEEFEYQFQLFGGYIRGGRILDFLVHTIPLKVFIEVNGEYWHRDDMSSEERFNLFQLEGEIQSWARLVILWGKDLTSEEETYKKVRDALR